MKSLVIIPTYNEIENVEAMITKVMSLPVSFDLLFVDDNSPDGTAKKIQELQKKHPKTLHLLSREKKSGLGTAYIAGFKWSLEKQYDFIFEMDCDFSHPPDDLSKLFHELKTNQCDMVIGSRYIKGFTVKNWPLRRIILSFGASIYVRIITLIPIKDPTAGFVGYTRKALQTLDLNAIPFQGYGFQIAMKFWLWKAGLRLKEVSIVFTERHLGKSKMSGSIVQEALFGIFKLLFLSISNPNKVIQK